MAARMDSAQLREIVRQATAAPSIHNTQPWRFQVGTDRVDLFVDPSRGLDVLDPTGRQRIISCGAALEHARLAVRAADHDAVVHLLPDARNEDYLARLEIGEAHPATAEDRRLLAAMSRRHTHRGAFDAVSVSADLLADMTRGAAEVGVVLHALTDPDDLVVATVLIDRADQLEAADPAYREELSRWVREDAEDGIPTAVLPPVGPRTSLPMRNFEGAPARPGGSGEDDPVERPLVVVLSTDGDGRPAWLVAGQAMGWVLLRAAADGVMASPLGQVLDVPVTRAMLARELRLLGHPQMVLRMGYPVQHDSARTPRRALDSVIDPPPG